jgi:serine/threonine protein phosphatase 1
MTAPITIAIADIHGRSDLLEALHMHIAGIASEYEVDPEIIYLGDICDRGDNSREAMELVSHAVDNLGAIVVRGNHDQLFCESIAEGCDIALAKWLGNGGQDTLMSYMPGDLNDSIEFVARKFGRHLDLVYDAKPSHVSNGVFFTHAGVNPQRPMTDQDEYDLMWIREAFMDHVGVLPQVVVHGHTVVGDRPVVTENRISLDTGAYASGRLTAVVFDWVKQTARFIQTNGDASSVVEVEPVLFDRGHGSALDFIFQKDMIALAA